MLIAEVLIPGAIVLGTGFVVGFVISKTKRCFFRCHEYGIHLVGSLGKKSIRFEDVASFTYGATRRFVNGVYQGTDFVLSFYPRPDTESKPIVYRTTLKGQDEEIENLREHISKVIAGGMARELSEGRPVRWTPHLRILPDGIECHPKGLLGRKEPVVVPFGQVANYGLKEGVFYLSVKGEPKPVASEEVSQPNFFPGYTLLNIIFSSPPQGQPSA